MSRRREMGETNEWSSLREQQRPKFYKIIHNTIIQNGSFELPEKIVQKIGKGLVDDGVAILKVPSGVEWRVKMIRESNADDNGGGVWLRNVRTFMDCYSISAGHFLVFRYDGNSQFHIVIFNMTGSEIEYHLFEDNSTDGSEDDHSNDTNNANSIECFEIEDSQEDVDYAETLSSSLPDSHESDEDDDGDETAEKPSKFTGSLRKNISPYSNVKEYVIHANEVERRFASTTTHPFFRIIVHTSYVEHNYLPIPWAFIRYFPVDLKDVKVIAVSDGRSWQIRIRHSKTDLRFSKGVTDFMKKKNGLDLKVGDVLIFEIVKKRCLVLKVHVFPAADRST